MVIEGLHRPTGPFSICELERAKSKIVEEKAAGPDNIPPEVIKRFDLDDIILDFANSLLIRGDKPNQWSSSSFRPTSAPEPEWLQTRHLDQPPPRYY